MLVLFLIDRKRVSSWNFNRKYLLFSLILLGVVLVFVMTKIPETTRVGRLPAILDWLGNIERGNFPYRAESNPSGFPILFFLVSPFYMLGDVGYFEVFGLLLFIYMILNSVKTEKEFLVKVFLLFSAIPVYYELAVRSELLANVTIFLAILIPYHKSLENSESRVVFYTGAILMGLLLSTRLVIGLLVLLFTIFQFRNNISKLILFSISSGLVFVITLIPFYLWDSEYFIANGPFSIQLLYLPTWGMLLFLIIILYSGLIISTLREYFFAGGLILFLVTLFSMSVTIFEYGLTNALFNDYFDISYFTFSIPLLILSIEDYENDKLLGKLIDVQ